MATLQQIEEEMQREAAIQAKIEKIKNKILKRHEFKIYRVIPTSKGADAVLVLDHDNIYNYNLIVYKENGFYINDFVTNHNVTLVYLKHRNPRDPKSSTLGHILKNAP